ncbi:conserved repeat domain protein, partial [Vibrio parahaemolyticus EKP-021]
SREWLASELSIYFPCVWRV